MSSYLEYTQCSTDKYNSNSFKIRNKHDKIAVRKLLEALRNIHANNTQQAHAILTELKQLYPDYFEVHRVFAYYYTRTNNIADASVSYKLAISQEPKAPQLRYLYARFLNEYDENRDEAISQLLTALTYDQESIPVMLELARLYMYSQQFERAAEMLGKAMPLIQNPSCSLQNQKIFYSISVQLPYRKADSAHKQRQYDICVSHLKDMISAYELVPGECKDTKLLKSICKSIRTVEHLSTVDISQESVGIMNAFKAWIDGFNCA